MKKSLSLILTALFIILSFVSCTSNTTDTGTEPGTSTQTEAPTDTPTEAPTTTEINDPSEDNSETGSESSPDVPSGLKFLKSDTGTQLNMMLEYDVAKNDDGSFTVDTTLKLESYSLNVTGRTNTNFVRIGDENYYFSTEAINYSGKEQTTFTLASHRFSVASGSTEVPVYAVWYFNGTYNDTPMAAIIIDGKISLE